MKITTLILSAALAATSLGAIASERCTEAAREEWMSREAIEQHFVDSGYTVREVETDNGGCYELKAIDRDGRKVEIYADPVDGRIVKEKRDD